MQSTSTLKNILISKWPPLKESIDSSDSPQGRAFLWLSSSASNSGDYSEKQLLQRFSLATLYFSTNGANWLNNEGWLSEENECAWFFSKDFRDPCDESGSIVNLELYGNGLEGMIPSELALLSSNLSRLDLAYGSGDNSNIGSFLSGSLPTEVGMLTLLEYINLNNQQLTGSIPAEIYELSLLTVLDFERNGFEGSISKNIGQLQQLHNLYLGRNLLSGKIPKEMSRLRLLVNLNLEGNQISSNLFSEVGKLTYLQTLSLANNNLTGTIPRSLGNLSNLQGTIDLSGNVLSGTLPTELSTMMLTVLNLSSNNLTGTIPSQYSNLISLGTLQLQQNNLIGELPTQMCNSLVTNKIENRIVPTFIIADCFTKIDCVCCQYCCTERAGCKCQFMNTDLEFLC